MSTCTNCHKIVSDNATKCRYCFNELIPNINESFFVTASTNSIEGYEIIENEGFVYGEVVCPNGILGALTNGTFFTISALSDARRKAIDGLQEAAKEKGANAIVGLDIDISDLNGNGVLVSANGNAVYIIPKDYKAKMDKKKQDQDAIRQKEEEQRQEWEKKKQDRLSSVNEITEEFSPLERMIYTIIVNNNEINPMAVMKQLPPNVNPSDASQAMKHLADTGAIEKTASGYYRVI